MPASNKNRSFDEAAFAAAVDAVLEEVRSSADVSLLHSCRAVFRKRVPLNLRAYVAAAALLRMKDAGQDGSRKKAPQAGRKAEDRRDAPGKNARKETEPKPAKARVANGNGATGVATGGAEADADRDSGQSKPREHRYHGEGVVVFVNAGRRQRFYARVAIALLDVAPGVGEDLVGDVRTMDNYSFIEVAPEAEAAAIAALNGYEFKGRQLVANRARKKGEAEATEAT